MPINQREFDRRRLDPARVLIDIFDSERQQAYSVEELAELIKRVGLAFSSEEMTAMLLNLVERGGIVSGEIGGKAFYTRRRLGFV